MQTKTTKLSDVELKLQGAGRKFSGYASVFNGVDSYDDTIEPGAFAEVIKSGPMPLMFFNHHSWEVPIGVWKSMLEDDNGLLMEGELLEDHSKAGDVSAAMKAGAIDGLSIGFRIGEHEEKDGIRHIKNIAELVETSIVTFPADNAARIDLETVKSAVDQFTSIKEFEHYLRDAGGFSRKATTALMAGLKGVLSDSEPEDEVIKLINNFKLSAKPLNFKT